MAKKRKSDATRLDEIDRTMYTSFCSAANSLSQLYTQAMNQQKLAFQAGERHSLEKLYQWILRQQEEEGSRVPAADIIAYLQHELDYGGEELPMSPRLHFQQHPQPTMHNTMIPGNQVSASFGPATVGQGPRSGYSENQAKNSVFSNALSSPIRRSLQHYDIAQGGYYPNNVVSTGNGARNETNMSHHQSRDSNSLNSNDSMDMHADSPGDGSSY